MHNVWMAADRAVFDIFLLLSLTKIQRDDNRFATTWAGVRSFIRIALLAALLLHRAIIGLKLATFGSATTLKKISPGTIAGAVFARVVGIHAQKVIRGL